MPNGYWACCDHTADLGCDISLLIPNDLEEFIGHLPVSEDCKTLGAQSHPTRDCTKAFNFIHDKDQKWVSLTKMTICIREIYFSLSIKSSGIR